MRQQIIFYLSITLLLCFAALGCTTKPVGVVYNTDTGINTIEPIVLGEIDPSFNKSAKFIAGLSSEDVEAAPFYGEYCKAADEGWNRMFASNRQNIMQWQKENLKYDYNKAVFYPFSGPDVLHPLSLYPELRELVMVGLEPTGGVPDVTHMNKAELNQLLTAINFTLDHAFFATIDMSKNIKPSSTNGISAIMLFFLSRGGYDVLSVKEITLPAVPNARPIKGVEILFADSQAVASGNADVKRVRYLQLDVGNGSAKMPTLVDFMGRFPKFTCVIKSASYLMHMNHFSQIRDLIFTNCGSILQDDTGIPYKKLKNSGSFDITVFGKYHKPLPIFKEFYQAELDKDSQAANASKLPFVYGYGYGYEDITYHVVLARRKAQKSADE